jgi:Flp pilus assembly protein TadG
MKFVRVFLFGKRGSSGFAQAALVIPLMAILTVFMISFGGASFVANVAANAANHGARVGSVYQQGAADAAYSAAMRSASSQGVGDYSVQVSGGGRPGTTITVSVFWRFPNLLGPLVGLPSYFSGDATSVFRQEGW